MDLLASIPAAFRRSAHAATRHLYDRDRPGHITCLFQPHPARRGPRVQAHPADLEADAVYRARMPSAIHACSYVLAGSGSIHYPDEERPRRLRPGSVFGFCGQSLHSCRLQPDPGMVECSLGVDGSTGAHLAAVGLWPSQLRCQDLGLQPQLLDRYLAAYRSIADAATPIRILLGQLVDLLGQIQDEYERHDPQEGFRRRATSLLARLHGADCSPRAAAASLGLPYETFRQRFRSCTGMPPREFQLRARMQRAAILLRDHSVADTAAALGYSDPFVFSRQFHRRMGVRPGRFRTPGV